VHAQAPRGQQALQQADAMITANPQVTLLMRFADCVPVFLYDPGRQAIGLVHAGWLGTARRTVVQAVRAMRDAFGTKPAELLAGLGPSIGPDHYIVGDEVVQAIRQSLGPLADELLTICQGQVLLDLWLANRRLLEGEGVDSVEVSGLCTACHLEDWYSHRAEGGKTGRFGALMALSA
jgi:YfiH family protein